MPKKITIILLLVVIIASAVFITTKVVGINIGSNVDLTPAGTYRITGLADPIGNRDAANKQWVITTLKGAGAANYIPKWDAAFSGFEKSKLYQSGVDLAADTTLGIFDMTKHEIRNMRIHNVTNDSALNPDVGQIWICTDAPGANATNYDCI